MNDNDSNDDIFDYEAHIFFDDAIHYLPNGSSEPNSFVQSFIQVIKDAAMYFLFKSLNLI